MLAGDADGLDSEVEVVVVSVPLVSGFTASLDFVEETRTAALTLMLRVHGDPVEVIRAERSRGRSVARVSDELSLAGERTDEFVVR